jgi:hypothetical protein
LFLETAGTWMCFDWDPPRFRNRLDSLGSADRKLTVVGPQARALRELTGRPFRVVEDLDFHKGFQGAGPDSTFEIGSRWLEPHLHANYNGEYFDGVRLRLAPTFSIDYSMNCPLACSFCYYAGRARAARPAFSAVVAAIDRICRQGHRHFYFTDPNFLVTTAEFAQLTDLYERGGRTFSYYCQVSPNFLTEARLQRLAASGCQGMVIGIENRARIADKGSIEEARERIACARALGMMPMLFFMIDEENDVEGLVEEFAGIPFRYTVINHAFAGDRSLASISAGFEAKRRLALRNSGLIERLQQRPDYLGFAERDLAPRAGGVR